MAQRTIRSYNWAAWLLSLLLALGALPAAAADRRTAKSDVGVLSHFRAAQLTWTASGRTVDFEVTFSARRSFYVSLTFSPTVGSTIIGPSLSFGDGNSSGSTAYTVLAIDTTNDVLIAEAAISHTYASNGPFTAAIEDCCRLSPPKHVNNPDGSIRTETLVDLARTTASPVSSIPPIVDCPKDSLCQFFVPAVDPDHQGLRFRLATSDEAAGTGASFVQPGLPFATNAASIDTTTGQYSWNTTGATLNGSGSDTFYSTQVIVENVVQGTAKSSAGRARPRAVGLDVVSLTAVDFFIRITDTPNRAPTFVSPTPADGTAINGTAGSPITFNVSATDQDSGDIVTLGIIGKPSGATFSTTDGNPANASFSWTPTAATSVVLNLTAQDQNGLGTQPVSITINVSPGQNAVHSWGKNAEGQLGDGSTTQRNAPVNVPSLLSVSAIAAGGGHSLVLKSDRTVWAWGLNDSGQLGNNSTVSSDVPVQVKGPGNNGHLTDVVAIAAGGKRSFALKADGTVWAWGGNADGFLGDGTRINRLTPVQVKGPNGMGVLTSVTTMAVSAGGYHTLALRSDGGVLAWGDNQFGQLGTAKSGRAIVPTPVVGPNKAPITTATAVAAGRNHSLVLLEDGSLLAFGHNADGQLGNGKKSGSQKRAAVVLAPTGAAPLTGIAEIAAGGDFSLARKTDGSLLAWGLNADGQLGSGNNVSSTRPVAVQGIGDAAHISAGGFHALAINGQGVVKAWGRNAEGQVGDGTGVNRNAPVAVSGLTSATAIAAGYWHNLAITASGGAKPRR